MPYNPRTTIDLGPAKTGKASTLRGQYMTQSGATFTNVGSAVSGVFGEVGSTGLYGVILSLPATAWQGYLHIYDTGDATINQLIPINPEEGEYLDLAISTRAAQTTALTIQGYVDELESRLTALRAGYLDNLSGGTTALAVDVLAIKNKTDNLPSSPAAVGSAMTLADGAITANKIAADAITAAKIASDAITAAKLAADAITEIQNGIATASSVAALQTILDKLNVLIEADGGGFRFTANALEQAPAGEGGGGTGTGTGDVEVDHNYSGTDALRFIFGTSGAGVDNGIIRAFLTSDYDASTYAVKGETRTKSDGRFVSPLMLDPGDYTLEYRLADESKAVTIEIAVEE